MTERVSTAVADLRTATAGAYLPADLSGRGGLLTFRRVDGGRILLALPLD
jgi:hypothetical protein